MSKFKYLFVFVFSLFFFSPLVFADNGIWSETLNVSTTYTSNNQQTIATWNNGIFNSLGPGRLYFSINLDTTSQTTTGAYLRSITVWSKSNKRYDCNIGTVYSSSTYPQNNITYSAVCPFDTTNNDGLYAITIEKVNNSPTTYVYLNTSQVITFVSDAYISEQLQNYLSQINSNISANSGQIQGYLQNVIDTIINQSLLVRNNISANSEQIQTYLAQILASFNFNGVINSINSNGQATTDAINNSTAATQEQTNTIKDSNTSGAESSATNFTNNSAFQDSTGLNAIISLPLNMINNLSRTCTPITLTIPYMDEQVTIPCISTILSSKVPLLYNLLKIVINGFIVYRILLDIFNIVKNAKNPDDDRIEVLEL